MSKRKLIYFIYLSSISVGALLLSNLAAIKLWNFFGIAVDGGIVVFPITYMIGDLIVEFYGKETAKHVIFAGFVINVLAVIVFGIVIALPAYPGWNLQTAYTSILGFTPRIILGSLIAYVCSNLFNNAIFTKLKQGNGLFASSFIARALCSSAFAHFIDSGIFEFIAFFGILSTSEFLLQAGFAYLLGFGFEIVLAPIEAKLQQLLKRRMHDYDLSK